MTTSPNTQATLVWLQKVWILTDEVTTRVHLAVGRSRDDWSALSDARRFLADGRRLARLGRTAHQHLRRGFVGASTAPAP